MGVKCLNINKSVLQYLHLNTLCPSLSLSLCCSSLEQLFWLSNIFQQANMWVTVQTLSFCVKWCVQGCWRKHLTLAKENGLDFFFLPMTERLALWGAAHSCHRQARTSTSTDLPLVAALDILQLLGWESTFLNCAFLGTESTKYHVPHCV